MLVRASRCGLLDKLPIPEHPREAREAREDVWIGIGVHKIQFAPLRPRPGGPQARMCTSELLATGQGLLQLAIASCRKPTASKQISSETQQEGKKEVVEWTNVVLLQALQAAWHPYGFLLPYRERNKEATKPGSPAYLVSA